MKLLNQKLLLKHLSKNKGNKLLKQAIYKLVNDFESNRILNEEDLKRIRPDADRVHSDGYYFLNIKDSRTMVLIIFDEEESMVIWCGNHDKYQSIFRNNKNTIKKWLKSKKLTK